MGEHTDWCNIYGNSFCDKKISCEECKDIFYGGRESREAEIQELETKILKLELEMELKRV